LEGASYDLRLGKKGIVTKSIKLEEIRSKISEGEVKEHQIDTEGSISIPPGSFALLTTLETLKLSESFAGHIGPKSYYTRKGLALLSGLQIDPGFEGVLVLGYANLSSRTITIEYSDPICTIELHRLASPAKKIFTGLQDQREGKIPVADKDYLRTIETMSITDLTRAMVTLSDNVSNATKYFKWIFPTMIAALIAAIGILVELVLALKK
jgi:deoxycytidine triphosphate deaminase